ncbi:hypothetical protein JCM33374_g2672 [Metschnikowia sp. JCM 33374]|nr:hypothetical protein JCM33374_g2672 [Metschnikowia sp. JCM 33374]
MIYNIPANNGIVAAVHKLFHVIQQHYDSSHRIVYFNNTSSGILARALSESTAAWVKEPQRTMQFEYERISSVFELVDKISKSSHDLIVVEHVDALMQEHTSSDYASENQALAHLMAMPRNMILIDTWQFLDTYYIRERL